MKPRIVYSVREYLLPAALFIGLAWALSCTPWFQRLENTTLDNITRFRIDFQAPVDPRLVTVAIDDDSIQAYGRWPWDRKIHGRFMYSMSFGKPSVVAWDILFTEPSPEPISDLLFKTSAAKSGGRVVFGAITYEEDANQPPPVESSNQPLRNIDGDRSVIMDALFALRPITALQEVGKTAFVDAPPSDDGVRRHVALIQRIGDTFYPSLALQTLMTYGNISPNQVHIILGDAIYLEGDTFRRRIPIDASGRYAINYRFSFHGSPNRGFSLLTEGFRDHYVENKPRTDLPSIEGKILLVGQVSTGLTDNGLTPFGAETPLVYVHANIINNVLQEDYLSRSRAWPIALGALLFGIIGMVGFTKRGLGMQALYAFGIPAIYLALASLAWIRWSYSLPLLWPVIGFGGLQVFKIVRKLMREQRSKQQIKGMFGTYISPALVERMISSGKSPQLGGHEENITAYFSDIQGFSAFSEKLPPDQLVVLMNEYLTACTQIIQEEGGTLDKYIGDAVVAMFGAPLPLPDHALRACVASQRIHVRLLELREKWKSSGDRWPTIVHDMQSRIGLNSGPVIVGNMGSETRFNYTMMGDNVNLAARMESGAKSWGVYSMCSEATREACQRDGADQVVFRPLGRIVVKGRSSAVPIFEIIGLKQHMTDKTRECIKLFELGLNRHFARDWDGALEFFAQSEPLEPNQPGVTPGVSSNPSRIYLQITRRYQIAPPPAEWEGEYVMTEK